MSLPVRDHQPLSNAGRSTCPVCAGSRAAQRFQRHGYSILECAQCGHHFVTISDGRAHVDQIYSDEYFTGGGAGYSDYLGSGKHLVAAGKRYGALLARHIPPGRLLDVGSAAGFLLKGFTAAGWRCRGIEPNATMAAHAQSELGMDMHVGTLEDVPPGETFDAVSLIQVVGHVYDLRRSLENARQLTRPGGLWLVECWDRDSIPARVLGRYWQEYSPPSVVHWFSHQSLRALLAEYGLREIAHGRPKKHITAAHAKSLLEHKLGRWVQHFPLANDWVLPYPPFDLFWAIYRYDGPTRAAAR